MELNKKEKIITVSEFNQLVNEVLSQIELIWIQGEVTDLNIWSNSWVFFKLKDDI